MTIITIKKNTKKKNNRFDTTKIKKIKILCPRN
jgi:hypothetical protein